MIGLRGRTAGTVDDAVDCSAGEMGDAGGLVSWQGEVGR